MKTSFSLVDLSFLKVESLGTPMHVASLQIFSTYRRCSAKLCEVGGVQLTKWSTEIITLGLTFDSVTVEQDSASIGARS